MMFRSGPDGASWETTPDGREGWATYFVRAGFAVYVMDQVGRGRSGFNPEAINRASKTHRADRYPKILGATREFSWPGFRFGPRMGEAYPGMLFPTQAVQQLFSQMVPDLNYALEDANATPKAIIALLETIGPSILLVHSESGPMGWRVAEQRPNARCNAAASLKRCDRPV